MDATYSSFVGVDIAKASGEVFIAPCQTRLAFENDAAGIAELIRQLPAAGTCLVVVEATGGYERLLVVELIDAGHQVAVANARQVRDYARGVGVLAKTDKIDAQIIARFAKEVQPRRAEKIGKNQFEIEQLVTRRRQLVKFRATEKCRLDQAPGRRIRQSVTELIDALDEQIEQIEREIEQRIQADDQLAAKAKLLQTAIGVGQVTSHVLVAEVPELGRLGRQKISALIGLAPLNNDSGPKSGKRSCWGGRASVRSALYMATLTAKRCNPVIRHFAERLEAKGKPFKVVMTACMRKLLTILNAMVKNNTPWNNEIILQTT